jgi:hypothetical protein
MKNISIKLLSLLVLIAMTFTSCLNDLEDYMGDFSGTPQIIEFNEYPSASTDLTYCYVTYAATPVDANLVSINIVSVYPLAVDTKVTLALDPAMVTQYNHDRGLDTLPKTPKDPEFYVIPAAALTVPSLEVTIPAGQREVWLPVKINPSLVPNFFNLKYMLAVKIVSATNGLTISGNNGKRYVSVGAKNKYHGMYHITGYFEHPSSPRPLNLDKTFTSVSANQITGGYADLGGSGYTYTTITIDEASNLTIPGRTERCYKVTFTFAPAVTWYVYDLAAAPGTDGVMGPVADHNYCWMDANNKWHFELYTGYNGTRKAHEIFAMY